MKLKKVFAVALGVMCFLMPISVNAEEVDVIQETTQTIDTMDTIMPCTEGLIINCSLCCDGGDKKVYITTQVIASEEMYKLGFKNIAIQRSSTGSNWATEVTISDDVAKNKEIYAIDNLAVNVQGGYYYRVKCTFFAQNRFLFPTTQSFDGYSYYTYVS